MGKVGERLAQKGLYKMVRTAVQRKSPAIYTLEMGKSIKFITLVVYKQEAPPREGAGQAV